MNTLANRILYLLLTGFVLSSAVYADDFQRSRPDRLGFSAERLERLDAVLKSYVEEDKLAGQVVLVLRNGRIVYSAANGMRNKEAGLPMQEDTIF